MRRTDELLDNLPGEEIVRAGMRDLANRKETIPALLVAIGRPRLNSLGLAQDLGDRMPDDPETRLYELLGQEHGNDAHSQHNAWIGRLVNFERALEHRVSRANAAAANPEP